MNESWDTNALAMGHVIASFENYLESYRFGPAIEPDSIINLDGRTRVYHGRPRPYVQRYPGWPTEPEREP